MANLISDDTCNGTVFQPPTSCTQVESNWAMVATLLAELCNVGIETVTVLPTFDVNLYPTYTIRNVTGGGIYISDGTQWIQIANTGETTNTSTIAQNLANGEVTHNSGAVGATDTVLQVVSQDEDNAISTGGDGGSYISCNALKTYSFRKLQEIWTGTQTSITIPAPAENETIVRYNFIAGGKHQAFNDGSFAPAVVDDFSYQVAVNGDGSITLTPDKTWGVLGPDVIIVEYEVEIDFC